MSKDDFHKSKTQIIKNVYDENNESIKVTNSDDAQLNEELVVMLHRVVTVMNKIEAHLSIITGEYDL